MLYTVEGADTIRNYMKELVNNNNNKQYWIPMFLATHFYKLLVYCNRCNLKATEVAQLLSEFLNLYFEGFPLTEDSSGFSSALVTGRLSSVNQCRRVVLHHGAFTWVPNLPLGVMMEANCSMSSVCRQYWKPDVFFAQTTRCHDIYVLVCVLLKRREIWFLCQNLRGAGTQILNLLSNLPKNCTWKWTLYSLNLGI